MSPWLAEFGYSVFKNLFQPLLLFFYMGFLVPVFKIGFEFPYVVYQGLVIYLLVSIGWKGGEELAELALHNPQRLYQALGFMVVGFITNFCIGCFAYLILRVATKLRRIDAATVAAYYGSDSAGTFVTCQGVLGSLQAGALAATVGYLSLSPASFGLSNEPVNLTSLGSALEIKDLDLAKLTAALDEPATVTKWESKGINIAAVRNLQAEAAKEQAQYEEAAYMPVMLAVMEIPGCLVGLYLVARLRRTGMDKLGNMRDEPAYNPSAKLPALAADAEHGGHGHGHESNISVEGEAGSKESHS
ncbi:MAG TPA: sodium-dependent bicarbonate transport family permease, partial [Pirellulales bacterium]|nr:sodium-dependent bicarbonate transport family permease [Pirellulales bacterium]